eukprot:TRINITY_DN1691_c0_g1_i4.p1 TRINITY_DN1691_c0_g1~~TRINITY_DN1691_c0_g1_i4.p1  ORF type:complete len:217 (-),score=33.96 TRINITY_DN1691_c0_g1_i4:137-697(-)
MAVDAKARLKMWGPALVVFTLVAAYAVTPTWPVWFWYHPVAMLVGYVALMGNAVLVKKIGGYGATKTHGYLMAAASAAAAFGWYVIYSNKEANGKPHITTWHGTIGLVCLLGTFASAIAGTGLLDPDLGMMKASKMIRLVHKNSGRFLMALAYVACAFGWFTMSKGSWVPVAIFAAPLPVFMYVLI